MDDNTSDTPQSSRNNSNMKGLEFALSSLGSVSAIHLELMQSFLPICNAHTQGPVQTLNSEWQGGIEVTHAFKWYYE